MNDNLYENFALLEEKLVLVSQLLHNTMKKQPWKKYPSKISTAFSKEWINLVLTKTDIVSTARSYSFARCTYLAEIMHELALNL